MQNASNCGAVSLHMQCSDSACSVHTCTGYVFFGTLFFPEIQPMDWEACLETSQLILPVSLPGVSLFKGECVERGREIEYELQGYLEMITFKDAWKWKASVVDKVTGLEASVGSYLNKKTALKDAMDLLFEKLEQHQELDYTSTNGSYTTCVCYM